MTNKTICINRVHEYIIFKFHRLKRFRFDEYLTRDFCASSRFRVVPNYFLSVHRVFSFDRKSVSVQERFYKERKGHSKRRIDDDEHTD